MNSSLFPCDLWSILSSFPRHIWETQIYDKTIPVSVVKVFHNKVSFASWDTIVCYSSYFSPEYLASLLGVVFVPFFFIGMLRLCAGRFVKVMLFFLILPILAIIWGGSQVGPIVLIIIKVTYFVLSGFGFVEVVKFLLRLRRKRS